MAKKLPKENSLAWSHYRVLGEIDDVDKRKYLENLAIENNFTVNELEQEVKNLNAENNKGTCPLASNVNTATTAAADFVVGTDVATEKKDACNASIRLYLK